MAEQITDLILEKIKGYKKIVIMRHSRPDGDAVGSTKGLTEILRASYPDKDIILAADDHSGYLSFLGEDGGAYPDDAYKNALGIVLDTATEDRISNKQFRLCREIIKIDHHIDIKPYGDISWVEDDRSSVCEMIAAFYERYQNELKMTELAAACIYTGMVTDSGRFRFESVRGRTMRLAGLLLDFGIDLEWLYANLYMESMDELRFKGEMLSEIEITENGVAYLYITNEMKRAYGLNEEQASECVSFMSTIKGSLIWLAFIENADGQSIRVRLRSRFVTVNGLAERYHGGGHACASGATVYSEDEMDALIDDADAALADYKRNNGGWL